MNESSPSTFSQLLIIAVTALVVFTIGLLIMTFGLRTLANQSISATMAAPPTQDLAQIPLTPFATKTPLPATAITQPTATPTPAATDTPQATETPEPTPTLTPTPTLEPTATETPPPTPYAGPFRPHGADYGASWRDGIIIDGDPGDWSGVAAVPLTTVWQGEGNWEGEDDFSGDVALTWDASNLYLAATIRDDSHVQDLRGYNIFNGDSIELWLDMDLATDFDDNNMNDDEYRIGFSAGNFTNESVPNPPEYVVWFPVQTPAGAEQILIAAQPEENGYFLETAIPWIVLKATPEVSMAYGFAITANDNDMPGTAAQQTVLSHSPIFQWGQPTTFSNLQLE